MKHFLARRPWRVRWIGSERIAVGSFCDAQPPTVAVLRAADRSPALVAECPADVVGLCAVRGGEALAVACADGSVAPCVDVSGGGFPAAFAKLPAAAATCAAATDSRGGGEVAVGCRGGGVALLLLDGTLLATLRPAPLGTSPAALAFAGSQALAVACSQSVFLVDLRSASAATAAAAVLPASSDARCVDAHPLYAELFATGHADGSVRLFDARVLRCPVAVLSSAHGCDVNDLRFHACSPRRLVSCSEDGSVAAWDLSADDFSRTTELSAAHRHLAPPSPVAAANSVDVDPDSQLVAWVTNDGFLSVVSAE